MKCPKCEKQNKPGVKNCEYCDEIMPVRKKKTSTKNQTQKQKKTTVKKEIKKTSASKTEVKKDIKKVEKEPLIELSDEKKALKKLLKRIKKINKMIYIYIIVIIGILGLTLLFNSKANTIICKTINKSETEKYSITLKIKKRKNEIKEFHYITKNITNSYDDELKSRYQIIMDDIERKDNYKDIVSSSLQKRSYEISYKFSEHNLDKTNQYIGLDLSNYKNDVNTFIEELEKEVGFTCK